MLITFYKTYKTLLTDVIQSARGEGTPLKMIPQAAVPTPPVRSPLVQSMIEEVRSEVFKALRRGSSQRSDIHKMLKLHKITDSQTPSVILTKVKTVCH